VSDTVVYASNDPRVPGRNRYVLAQGGLFTQLADEAEVTNMLFAFNLGRLSPPTDPTSEPQQLWESYKRPDGKEGRRPIPAWLTEPRLTDLISQSQRAVRGGSAA
jgi:hypothetical protein